MNRPVFSALFLFLLPALLVAAVVASLNFLSLHYVSDQQTQGAKIVQKGLRVLDSAIGQVVQLGLLHDTVSRQLLSANAGEIDEPMAYLMHVHVVDQLALIEENAKALSLEMIEAGLSNEQLQAWQGQFDEYRRLVLMATDIVAIEPKVAGRYVDQAQMTFFIFSAQTFSLTSQLSDLVANSVTNCQNNIQRQFHNSYWVLIVGIVISVLIALFASRYLSRQLRVLLSEMRELSIQKSIPDQLPQIEALTHSSSFEIRRLAAAILSFHQAMKDRDAEQARSYQLAFHDHLTGLPNRTKMLVFTDEALLLRNQDAHKGGIIKLNINGLKVVNDGLGYDQGNQLLVQVGERLCVHLSSTCVIARSSSDEFVLLIRDIGSESHADDVLRSVMRQIHRLFDEPFQLKQQQVFITVVLGAAIFPMSDKEDAEETFMHAMIALHAAKGLNTEQSLIYHPQLEDQARARVQVESALRNAIANDHLVLYFQPQVKSTGEIVSVETLVRWNDPEKGLIPPGLFIPMAEQSDLIIDVDRWVLSHACQALKQLQDAGSDLHVSVNISGRHFAKDFFVTSIMDIVNDSGIKPHGLMLEVTEGIFIADLNDVVGKMSVLREQGIAFSIDDFGTGYSSLQYLKRLPIQELKIDKSFIDGLPTDVEDIALVKTIIGIAQNLELLVVIEGVETQPQIDLLNTLGDFVMQGYFYAKPQPAQAVIQQILTHR